ncbi:MAG: 2OG-Fe(II) oxygenase [Proteobacteria bacterium]|nr:2OG-Fe(II) oxygenase [Pseudomonadota bacterium]
MPGNEISGKELAPLEIIPPYLQVPDFLDARDGLALLEDAVNRELAFVDAGVGARGVDLAIRQSRRLPEAGGILTALKEALIERRPWFFAALRMPEFIVESTELELVAHGHGAFYKRHVDTQVSRYAELRHVRVLSCVYYFHREPKAFTGGALRLHAIGDAAARFVDIEPLHNSLVVFPAWAPHEVLPVDCPSQQFADSRFAVNCWFSRLKPNVAT